MLRLFIGSFLQEEEAARIDQFGSSNQQEIQALTASNLRFVTAANLHITWVFLGDVGEEKLTAVKELMQREVEFLKTGTGIEEGALAADRPQRKYGPGGLGKKISIDVEYDFIESWPSATQSRVLVATPTVVPDEVLRIGMALRESMSSLGNADKAEARNRLFRPHVTLARVNPPANLNDGRLITVMEKVLPIKQKIERLHLIKSNQGQGMADYEIIETVR